MRWEIAGIQNPCDARIVSGNRVLIAEHGGNCVTERTFTGDIVWKQEMPGPIQCQRLPNGNTFLVSMQALLEVDRTGKEVFRLSRSPIRAAYKYPDGTIGLVGPDTLYVHLDASGKELKQRTIQVQISNGIGGVEFLHGGGLVVTQGDKVVEYAADGQVKWQVKVPGPYPLTRLPNGHTLVASTTGRRFIEFDRTGREVWSHEVPGTPWIARRR
jgi:outer membrane protein assembly factor BamB